MCRKKKRDEDDDGEPKTKKARTVDDVLEQITNRSFILRHNVRGKDTQHDTAQKQNILTLDSGATTHMVPKHVADLVSETDLV